MSSKDKPYKVYRGGRTKGPIKPIPKESPRREPKPAPDGDGYDGGYAPAPKKRRRWGRKVAALLAPHDRARDRVGNPRLPRLPQRRQGCERAPRPGSEGCTGAAGRLASLESDQRAPARRRRREQEPRRVRERPLRLDHAHPHRSRRAPVGAPLDPARPPRHDPGPRRGQGELRLFERWSCPRDQDDCEPDWAARQPRHDRRLQVLRRSRRRDRRRHDQREEADPLEVRVSRTRRSAAPAGRAIASARGNRR